MQTPEIKITTTGAGMEDALTATEKLGIESSLGRKENLRLRLLAEELIGLLRGIAGSVEALYQASCLDGAFALRLSADIVMNQEMRKQLLAASTTGKNSAARGFMGRLREMVAIVLLPGTPGISALSGLSLGLMSMGSPGGYTAGDKSYVWSMNRYISEVKNNADENEEAAAAWDELERSIVANLADEVSVRIVGSSVEITIAKTFGQDGKNA